MPSTQARRPTDDMTADERQPLLRQVKSREDVYDDIDLPEDWSLAYKWGIVALLAFMAFAVYVEAATDLLVNY